MNALAVWKVTGATIDRGQRLFIAVFWIAMTLIALALVVFWHDRGGRMIAPLAYALGMGFWWTFVVGRTLLLQRDARALHIPGVDRTTVLNLSLQYVLSALLPAMLLAVFGDASFLRSAAFFSCIAAGALMFQVLPRYLGMFIAILPSGLQILSSHGVIPGFSDPGFATFGWSFAFAMAAIAAWRWRVVLNTAPEAFGSWSIPLVIQAQRQFGLGSGLKNWDSNMVVGMAGKGRLHIQARMSGIGPRTPVNALRVWLGGAFVPVTLQARLGQVAFVLLPMVVAVGFSLLGHSTVAIWTGLIVFVGGTLAPLMIMSVAPARLQRFYTNPSGEVSLLALLPGIDRVQAKRNLQKAALGVPLIALAIFYVFVLAAAAASGGKMGSLLALTLCTLGATTFGVVWSLAIAAGKPISKAVVFVISALGLILLFTTPSVLPVRDHGHAFERAADLVLSGWFLLYAVLGWLFVRGRGAYARRPHAFLLNDR